MEEKTNNSIIKSLNLEDLTGEAEILLKSSTTSETELGAIHRACKEESKRCPEGLKVVHDGKEFYSMEKTTLSGEKEVLIRFNVEMKTDSE